MSRSGVVGLVMVVFGLITVFVLIPTQISRLSQAILATGVSPKAFPQVAAWGVTAFGLLVLVQDLVAQRRPAARAATQPTTGTPMRVGATSAEERTERSDAVGLAIFFGAVVLYVALLPVLGHLIATPLAIAGYMFLLGERRWVRIAITAVLTTAVLSFFFRTLLNTILPTGIFY